MRVERRNRQEWQQISKNIHVGLRDIADNTPVGDVMRSIVHEEIKFMKSLPLEAADRVVKIQDQAMEAVINGQRPDQLYNEIMRSGDVARSRAKLIARTEVGRASGALTQARALAVGSTGYIWRTSHDAEVRSSHRSLDGKFIRWEDPPTTDNLTYHAGCGPNCRCTMEVVVPDSDTSASNLHPRILEGIQ